jgi:DtxR family Mn-dependent transcriptional regulator
MRRVTASSQDYLKAIYTLSARHGKATTTKIAARVNVQMASATSMVQKLAQAKPPLAVYHKHRGATLTVEGEQAALTVIRRHRLLELYLCEKLGYTWDEVHEEAERLEHVVSPELIAQIAAVLDNPTAGPHGQPIPSSDLAMPVVGERPLTTLTPGTHATIQRVRDKDAELLRYLAEHHLRPGVVITVQACQPDGTIYVLTKEQLKSVRLSSTMAQQIFVNNLPIGTLNKDEPGGV